VAVKPVNNRQRLTQRFTVIGDKRRHQPNRIEPPVLQRILRPDADIHPNALIIDALEGQRDAHPI
jgi:hypothetical protein